MCDFAKVLVVTARSAVVTELPEGTSEEVAQLFAEAAKGRLLERDDIYYVVCNVPHAYAVRLGARLSVAGITGSPYYGRISHETYSERFAV